MALNNKYEKIWLALIPVLGAIIIACITYSSDKKVIPINVIPVINKNLLSLAGEVHQIAVYNNYNDLYPLLSETMKVFLTNQVFYSANDSMKNHLGNYIRSIDTSRATAFKLPSLTPCILSCN